MNLIKIFIGECIYKKNLNVNRPNPGVPELL